MTLLFERVKAPDGVNDVRTIQIDGIEHFIISFGSMIKIFSSEFKLVSGFLIPFNVLKILPYQDHYFLIGRDKYQAYKGIRKVSEHTFFKHFGQINKVLAIRNFLVILHDERYSLAKIQEMEIKQEDALTDSAFFTPLSAEKINDFIYILARTYSRKYLITYAIENNSFKCQRREVPNGSIMFEHLGQLMFLDENGMWLMREKLSYIREFGNYKVSCALSIEGKSLLFCRNGEVLSLDSDNKYEILGTLDCSVDVVAKLGGLYFCGSLSYSYLLKISDKKVRTIERYACVGRNEVISKKEDIEMVCNKDFVTMRYAISINQPARQLSCSSAQSCINGHAHTDTIIDDDSASSKRFKVKDNPFEKDIQALQRLPAFPKRFFKGVNVTVLSFENFSLVNGVPFELINSYSSYGAMDIFGTSSFIFEADFSKKSLIMYKVTSCVVRYFGPIALIFRKNVVSVLDTISKSLKSHDVDFELCDFCINGNLVYCIDFNESIYKIPMEDFYDCCLEWTPVACLSQLAMKSGDPKGSVEKSELVRDKDILTHSILNEIKRSCDILTIGNFEKNNHANLSTADGQLGMLNVNGRLFRITNGRLDLVADIGSFISCFANFGDILVILADKTYAMDLNSKKISVVDIKATDSFIYQDQLYLYGNGQLVPFELKSPTFIYKKVHCDISNSESLICKTDNGYVYSYFSIDRKAINYRLNDSTLKFPLHIESCRCVIRNGLICVALINISTKASKLVFISVKDSKLRIRKEVPQDLVPLSICSFGNIMAFICPDQIMILKIKNNRIRRLKRIENRNDLCTGSCFIGKKCILISNDDWCFKTVDLRKGAVKETVTDSKCIPFALNGAIGYAATHKVYFPNGEIDCIEDISNVVSIPSEVLVFGRNGSVFRIKGASNDEASSNYIYETSLKYYHDMTQEDMYVFE